MAKSEETSKAKTRKASSIEALPEKKAARKVKEVDLEPEQAAGSSKAKPAPAKAGKPKQAAAPKEPAKARKTPAQKPVPAATPGALSDEQRYRMVAEAAYYRAESRQFQSDPLHDWVEAEKDIAARLGGPAKHR